MRTRPDGFTPVVRTSLTVVLAFLVIGCSGVRPLMPTPVVYVAQNKVAFDALDPAVKGSDVRLFYATDRIPAPVDGRVDPDDEPAYGYGRSASAALGIAEVSLGGELSWSALEADARSGQRRRKIPLEVLRVEELMRTPETPYQYRLVDGRFELPPETQSRLDDVFREGAKQIDEVLANTPRNEAFVYVHGVGTTFNDALYVGAEFWHYLGREGVPIVYSWPAGRGGFNGYAYDRESSEYTITHFKHFLEGLATYEQLERIHIIAHSRGTDVVTTALRELFAETRAAGIDPAVRFRIGNLVLAAPDLNLEIVQQRSTRISFAVERLTIYTSGRDRAVGVASFLFSGLRLGRLRLDTMPEDMQNALARISNLSIVEYVGDRGGDYGHNYFRLNPAVASDLILLLRYDLPPGGEHGRPLSALGANLWQIDDDYLQ
ncbi:MAG: alpha/beta hydrolase [Pseudomonadota bacterium]